MSLIWDENSAYGRLETIQHIEVNINVMDTAGPAMRDDWTIAVYIPDPRMPPTLIRN